MSKEYEISPSSDHKSYETRTVTNWLLNDEDIYLEIHRLLKSTPAPDIAGKIIEEFVAQNNPLADMVNLYSELLEYSLEEVDWDEVALKFTDE